MPPHPSALCPLFPFSRYRLIPTIRREGYDHGIEQWKALSEFKPPEIGSLGKQAKQVRTIPLPILLNSLTDDSCSTCCNCMGTMDCV